MLILAPFDDTFGRRVLARTLTRFSPLTKPVRRTDFIFSLAKQQDPGVISVCSRDTIARFSSIEDVSERLASTGYVADRALSLILYLSTRSCRPVLLEGEAGVGKTELAKALAECLGRTLIRLQCYEGLDVNDAVYTWNFPRQMLTIRMAEARGESQLGTLDTSLYTLDNIIARPLLSALLASGKRTPPVLLIDEIDRADEAFEAFLLEILSDFQISIPEFGTIRAKEPPIVIITSNRTRELHDALKRRCFYHWVDFPSLRQEQAIIASRLPGISEALTREVVAYIHRLREEDIYKAPGIAESIDWSQVLVELSKNRLDNSVINDTLGVVLKNHEDITRIAGARSSEILREIQVEGEQAP